MGFPQMRERKMLLLIAPHSRWRGERILPERALLLMRLSINLLQFERPRVNFDHIKLPARVD
jgi:hypothetical protein